MSHLKYSNYEGYGDNHASGYSQAVRVGDIIKISGQGGWDPNTEEISTDLAIQTDQAFANVELTLRQAGGRGWEQVYQIRCYSAPISDEAIAHLVRNVEKYCPNHRPIITGIGVAKLAYENMMVEIEVEAHLGS
ncbi:hypothetical protein PV11_00518 [Exophiala sideris]|uniref:Uncharacterized protein n=1 Tax=Exophiala sideris TaxID=1016849 RepID=A0A0D1YTD4_9EURO|nr:hypothetical protein PV11_00518 [Exophiala sideris]